MRVRPRRVCGTQTAGGRKEGLDGRSGGQVIPAARPEPHRLNVPSGLTHAVSESQ